MRTHTWGRARTRGLTLVELLLAVVIVGVLTKLAMPRYTEHVQRSHRTNAKAALLKVAQFMERAATASGVYPQATNVPSALLVVQGGRYDDVSVTVATDGSTFALTAKRKTGTAQANDDCGDFIIEHTGETKINNAATGFKAMDCWGR